MKINGNIIIMRTIGAFNEYGAQNYTNAIKSAVDSLQGNSFSILVNNLAFLGGTPEAYQELENYNAWLNQQNFSAKAMVINCNTTLDVIHMLSPSMASQKTKNFDNEEEAMAWLQNLN